MSRFEKTGPIEVSDLVDDQSSKDGNTIGECQCDGSIEDRLDIICPFNGTGYHPVNGQYSEKQRMYCTWIHLGVEELSGRHGVMQREVRRA